MRVRLTRGGVRGRPRDRAGLPEVEESTTNGSLAFRVRGKLFLHLCTTKDTLAIRVGRDEVTRCYAADPSRFFVNRAHETSAAVLTRLDNDQSDLAGARRQLITDAWRRCAPRSLAPSRALPAPLIEAGLRTGVAPRSRSTNKDSSVPVEVEFTSVLEAPPAVVWDRVVRVTGANDELWPLAKMTRPSVVDRLTAPGQGGLPPFRSWFLLFGVVPIDRRTMQLEVLEEGRFVESSTSWLNGQRVTNGQPSRAWWFNGSHRQVGHRVPWKARGRCCFGWVSHRRSAVVTAAPSALPRGRSRARAARTGQREQSSVARGNEAESLDHTLSGRGDAQPGRNDRDPLVVREECRLSVASTPPFRRRERSVSYPRDRIDRSAPPSPAMPLHFPFLTPALLDIGDLVVTTTFGMSAP